MKNAIPKFDVNDLVQFENKIYKIKKIHCLSTGNCYSFVYSLLLVGKSNFSDKFKLILEHHIAKPNKKLLSTWNSLYGLG